MIYYAPNLHSAVLYSLESQAHAQIQAAGDFSIYRNYVFTVIR